MNKQFIETATLSKNHKRAVSRFDLQKVCKYLQTAKKRFYSKRNLQFLCNSYLAVFRKTEKKDTGHCVVKKTRTNCLMSEVMNEM